MPCSPTLPILILEFILKNVKLCYMTIISQKQKTKPRKKNVKLLTYDVKIPFKVLTKSWGGGGHLFCFLLSISLGENSRTTKD